ncbi:MAG: sulfurtransferase [Xanthomonadaceae bacterium]|nr:sulfurtransferase [Xanthomonadaceae bacterium]
MKTHIETALAIMLAWLASATVRATELPGPIVSPQWLARHRGEVNIVDVRDDPASFARAPRFAAGNDGNTLSAMGGHIPGAVLLDFGKVRVTRRIDGRRIQWMLPDRAYFQALIRGIGVQAGRPTVIVPEGVDGNDLDMAARVYWSMKVYGDDRIALLDGGTSGWLRSGMPFATTTSATSAPGTWTASAPRMRYVATSADVSRAIGHGQIVDARPMPFYLGLARKPMVLAAGHVKGAVDMPPDLRAVVTGGSAHYLTAAQYAGIFRHLDIAPHKATITYCNTGHLAAGAWFVLHEIMKNPDVRLYDGSMHEWTTENRPVVGL